MNLSRFVPAVVVLAALGAIGGAAAEVKPAPPVTAALVTRQVPVTAAIRACPAGSDGGQDRLAVYASGVSAASDSPSAATVTPLWQSKARAATIATVTTPGVLTPVPVPATSAAGKQQAWSITASGAMASGLEAEVADSAGLGSVSCGAPASSLWFVGPGQQDGVGQIQLDLMNVDALAATVDVNVITEAGPAQTSAYAGINVPPHQFVVESLSSLAGGNSVVAINVRTSAGRVAADVSESSQHGGVSWLPASAAPSTSLVIPGVPPSSAGAGLFVVVPGDTGARVNVVALTTQGRYEPPGSEQIDLPGGSATYVPLTALGSAAVTLLLSSNVPVTAAVLVPGSGLGAFTAAAEPIIQQAVFAGNTTNGGLVATVVLAAPAQAVRVRVTETAPGAAAASQIITVSAGRTINVTADAPKRGEPFTIVLTPQPGSGPLYAARVESQGAGGNVLSIIPATSALTTISLPPVRDSYTAISP
jgi:Family of unknown function (DUF5719)